MLSHDYMKTHRLRSLFLLFLAISVSDAVARMRENLVPDIPYTDSFDAWLEAFKNEAREEGISDETLNAAFAETRPIPRIIELDRKQPESTLTLEEYLKKVISETRITTGQEMLAEHHNLLKAISDEYGVEPEFIVALWGIETNYGGNTGSYSTIDALATLAYDGRRSSFFRSELLKALKISDADHISPRDMQGSWAGAMGQCQFMPSSFLAYAVDRDGDGKHDIWNTLPDVFASIANYLHKSGWKQGEDNTDVILKWNRSSYFAAAVNKLAKQLRKRQG